MDETLAFGWDAVLSLRTTFPAQVHGMSKVFRSTCAHLIVGQHAQQSLASVDPVLAIPLNLDRLQCSVLILCDLLRYVVLLLNLFPSG